MCPFCLTTAAIVASSVIGTGGLTTLVAGTLFKKKRQQEFPKPIGDKEDKDGNSDNRSEAEERRFA